MNTRLFARIGTSRRHAALVQWAAIILFTVVVLTSRFAVAGNADVSVTLYEPILEVYTNDWMPYTVTVTNLGPSVATNVTASSTMPSGFSFIDVAPASQSYTFAANTLTLNFGNLTNQAVRNVFVRVKPSNAGIFTYTATAASTGSTDTNSANDTSSLNLNVGTLLAGQLVASIVSTQKVDLQTGVMLQWIQVSNSGPSQIPAARVHIAGLTNQLYNASGTNNGIPFVVYPSPLDAHQTGKLLLEFVPRTAFSFTNSQLTGYQIAMPSLKPPRNLGQAIPMLSASRVGATDFVPGRIVNFFWNLPTNTYSYTVLYADNPEFANPLVSLQSVPLDIPNQVEWIDYGPPSTVSVPTASKPRFYRAYVNPR